MKVEISSGSINDVSLRVFVFKSEQFCGRDLEDEVYSGSLHGSCKSEWMYVEQSQLAERS